MILSLLLYVPKLDEEVSGGYKDLTEPIKLPGCVPDTGVDLPDLVQNQSSEPYKHFLECAKAMVTANGILINTFLEMESGAIRVLEEFANGKIRLYPVGPITQKGSSNKADGSDKCLRWLDKQPPCSVLYVCFRSGGIVSQRQINELASGLELSCQRFLLQKRTLRNSYQKMNAMIITDGLKVALRPKFNEHGILEKEEIVKVIKCLMDGEEGL
ncbi:Hydroquinone glucosyltransferase [Spatholobus suberectus]|nr:Hydroquinone glucosyltransferase [Spatholobus suberectus]